MRAYEAEKVKAAFPYEWFDSFDHLQETAFPPYKAFTSSIKGPTDPESYIKAKEKYQSEKMGSMRVYLEYYNKLDLRPFLTTLIFSRPLDRT